MDILKMLDLADEEAKNSSLEYQMGAILVIRNNIIGQGHCCQTSNIPQRLYRTHPRASKWHTMHAEMSALRDALYAHRKPQGATVIISGFTRAGGRPVSCRPCRNCLRVLREYRVKRAIWRDRDMEWCEGKLLDMDVDERVCSSCDQSISSWKYNGNLTHR